MHKGLGANIISSENMEVVNNQQTFAQIKRILNNHSTLLDAYGLLEPIILGLFDAQRMSIFQRRRQHQDLVARFKTGKETLEIKVPISPMSIAGDSSVYPSAILKDPEQYFTEEVMQLLEEASNEEFSYGE